MCARDARVGWLGWRRALISHQADTRYPTPPRAAVPSADGCRECCRRAMEAGVGSTHGPALMTGCRVVGVVHTGHHACMYRDCT